MSAYAHLDRRTRPPRSGPPIEPASLWEDAWAAAIASNGERAAADAAHLGLGPIALRVDHQAWTLTPGPDGLALRTAAPTDEAVALDRAAFTELITGRRTAMGLAVAGQLAGTPAAIGTLCAWDAVLRSLLEGRSLYRPGDIALRARDGSPLALDRRFTLEPDGHDDAAHFLAEAGYLVLQGVFTDEELDRCDAELAAAVADATPDDGTSWWASTRDGTRYPCRILDLADRSPAARELLRSSAFLAIGDLLGLGHRPGDPFGEHFARPTIEGLTKRVDSVDGLVCLPVAPRLRAGRPQHLLLRHHRGDLPDPRRPGARRARRVRRVPQGQHRQGAVRSGPRPADRVRAGATRRCDGAPVVHAAPLDPPHHS